MNAPVHPYRIVSTDDVLPGSDWLGPRERRIEAGLTRAHRLSDWRRGRYAAKSLLASRLHAVVGERSAANDKAQTGFQRIDIDADPEGAPRVWVDGRLREIGLSISHRSEFAVATASADERVVGIDLELVEPRTDRFVQDFFTEAEARRHRELPRALRDIYAVAVWSAKEGVLKVARTGLRRDTRTVEIDLMAASTEDVWQNFAALDQTRALRFDGWWVRHGHLLITLVSPVRSCAHARPRETFPVPHLQTRRGYPALQAFGPSAAHPG